MLASNLDFDAGDVGLQVRVVVFRARDDRELNGKAVEIGIADRSLLDLPGVTPGESRLWEPER